MRAGYHEHGYSGATMRPDVNDGRRYNGDPYNNGNTGGLPQGYIPHGRPSSTLSYDSPLPFGTAYPPPPIYNGHRSPTGYGPPQGYPRVDPRFAEPPQRSLYPVEQLPPYTQRPIYLDERNYPTVSYERQPAHYLHDQHSNEYGARDYPVHAAPPRRAYPQQQVDHHGRHYPVPFDPHSRHYVDSRGPPVSYHANIPPPSRPSFLNPTPESIGYPPQPGYASPASYGPPGGHMLPVDRSMSGIPVSSQPINHANARGESMGTWNQQQGVAIRKEIKPPVNYADGLPRETDVSEILSTTDYPHEDDASSLEEPEQEYEERYEDDDTIATQDAIDNGIDFLDQNASKRFGVNLDFSQLETVGEDESEPEYTPDRTSSARNPMDPRFWFVLPPPNGISILKGTRFARNSPIENRVTFWQCDVTKIGEADYMFGVRPEVIWWTKAELNNRLLEDDKDRLTNPVAKIYDQECTKAFEKLTERVKKALDRNRHPKPAIQALWNDTKLAKLVKAPLMTGLSFGFRGIELGSMAGRRVRARGHFQMIKEYMDESNYRTKRKLRTARRGDAMGLASEEYTLIVRLWARTMAMADQAGAHVVNVLDARDQRARKQAAREKVEL